MGRADCIRAGARAQGKLGTHGCDQQVRTTEGGGPWASLSWGPGTGGPTSPGTSARARRGIFAGSATWTRHGIKGRRPVRRRPLDLTEVSGRSRRCARWRLPRPRVRTARSLFRRSRPASMSSSRSHSLARTPTARRSSPPLSGAGVVVMCDHTFCYTPVVEYLKSIVADGTLGDIQFFDSVRINLGLVPAGYRRPVGPRPA